MIPVTTLRFKDQKRKRRDGQEPGSPSKSLAVSHSDHPPEKKSRSSGSRALLGPEVCDAIANVVRQEVRDSLKLFSANVEKMSKTRVLHTSRTYF